MVGGKGNDTYVVDNAGDVVTEVSSSGFTPSAGWTIKGTADFNHDGVLDAVVRMARATVWYLTTTGRSVEPPR